MKTMNMDLAKAYEFVKEKRPCISPNLHFMGQLLEFQKQLQEERERQESDATDGKDISLPPTPVSYQATASTGMYYAVSVYDLVSPVPEVDSDCDGSSRCSSSSAMMLQSTTSAPSSLNFDNATSSQAQEEPMETSTQVTATATEVSHRTIKKPKTLPLRKSISIQEKPSECQPVEHHFVSIGSSNMGSKGLIGSISLPTTPILSQYRNHLRLCRTPSPLPYPKPPHPLQHSPCRVVASLGSRSETCLNYFNHTPIAESN